MAGSGDNVDVHLYNNSLVSVVDVEEEMTTATHFSLWNVKVVRSCFCWREKCQYPRQNF